MSNLGSGLFIQGFQKGFKESFVVSTEKNFWEYVLRNDKDEYNKKKSEIIARMKSFGFSDEQIDDLFDDTK